VGKPTSSSVESILVDPDSYEALVPSCTELVRLALQSQVWRTANGKRSSFVDQYGQVLFCLAAAKRALDELLDLGKRASLGVPTDKGHMQEKFRHFVVDLKGAVEHAERLLKNLSTELASGVAMECREQLRLTRNKTLHERAGWIRISSLRDRQNSETCCQTFGSIADAVHIEFRLENTPDGRELWYSPSELEETVFAQVRLFIESDVTKPLIELLRREG
jgi:hypothetical protein